MAHFQGGVMHEHDEGCPVCTEAGAEIARGIDLKGLKTASEVAHARIERALGLPPLPPPETKERLDAAIGLLIRGLTDAHKLACRLEDPRRVRILAALSEMPGDAS